jgi:hypothetical protein
MTETNRVFIPFSICIVSALPLFEAYECTLKKLLHEFNFEGMSSPEILKFPFKEKIESVLSVFLSDFIVKKEFFGILSNELPLIDYSIRKLFSILDLHVIFVLLKALLCESKIIVHSNQLSLLNFVTESAISLIYPFLWNHTYIPVLPESLLNFTHAPVPFLFGVHSSLIQKVLHKNENFLLILDVDKSSFRLSSPSVCNFENVPEYPEEHQMMFIASIQQHISFSNESIDISKRAHSFEFTIRKLFMENIYDLLYDYRNYIYFYSIHLSQELNPGQPIQDSKDPIFDKESFLKAIVPNQQAFYATLLSTHAFSTFIEHHKHHHTYLYVRSVLMIFLCLL